MLGGKVTFGPLYLAYMTPRTVEVTMRMKQTPPRTLDTMYRFLFTSSTSAIHERPRGKIEKGIWHSNAY